MIQIRLMNELDPASTGQLTPSAAEIYEDFFVPALFTQWTEAVLDGAGVSAGDDVLDVGCGTGILARAACRRLSGFGTVTGVDINDGMLKVARRLSKAVDWRHGPAEHLPFPRRSFDRVISQFALMFFADQSAGIREMTRVTRPGGTITIATWASIDQSPGYAAMLDLVQRVVGDEAAAALQAPFSLGTEHRLLDISADILPNATITRHEGRARFDSLEAWIHTDVRGWTLAELVTDDDYEHLVAAARTDLAQFVDDDGQVRFPTPALILSAASSDR